MTFTILKTNGVSTNPKETKNLRADEIKALIKPFAIEFMDEETYASCLKLLHRLARKWTTMTSHRSRPCFDCFGSRWW
jgi:hypothetical protein